ncbi:MAG: RNA-binding transcriptional accessory protein [Bacteroidales bacterium]|nr:RNA-binding transcriptional accessory protein [Bacteroidales bacterium]
MNKKWILLTAEELGLKEWQIENTWRLAQEGATIPFIARYRKEVTGNLDEVLISQLFQKLDFINEFEQRRNYILTSIAQQNLLTEPLKKEIEQCYNINILEDLYLPFKPKRKNKASIARELGLEPLAKLIFEQHSYDIPNLEKYLNEKIDNEQQVLEGAKSIIIEWIYENRNARELIRQQFAKYAEIKSKVIKTKIADAEKYKNYFDFKERLQRCPSHRILAMLRGENEGFLKVSICIDDDIALDRLSYLFIKGKGKNSAIVSECMREAYLKHIKPSIENEYYTLSKQAADKEAIKVFSDNLKQLLLTPPIGEKRVMGIDPGYKTGCKVVCIDEHGTLLHNETIYPHPPQNEHKLAEKKIVSLVNAYKIDYIAVGNGTASRETEAFLSKIPFSKNVKIYVVSEAGASVYSASDIARKEFPNYDITVRGAVSIARRLQDPLAELVKIEPKAIGIGQYQHDVDQKLLKIALEETVIECVNKVGVQLNSCSEYLLQYVSGIGEKMAQTIVEYRKKNGRFNNIYDLLKVPWFGEKAFKLSAGFLRIENGDNPLDNTGIHPEKYDLVEKIAFDLQTDIHHLIGNKELIAKIDIAKYISDDTGEETLKDIVNDLMNPGYDMRFRVKILEFDPSIKHFENLKIGMVLNGIVTNITNFGAFINIGIKESGLLHISNITNEFIKNPNEILHIHQHVKVKVIGIDEGLRRISLSMKDVN